MIHRLFAFVVDDDPSVCRALRRLLQSAGMEVETSSSAEGFLHATLRREPDCLVLDIRMPGISGPELRDRLYAMGRRIPVVFITAHGEGEDGTAAAQATILHKPFGDEELLNAIHTAVLRDGVS